MILSLLIKGTHQISLAETVGVKEIKAAENYTDDFPVKVEKTAKAVLSGCTFDTKSRYKNVVSSLSGNFQIESNASPLTCNGLKATESELKSTRDLLTELRKIREKEIYEVEALNQLLYDPDHFKASDPDIGAQLRKMLCERSSTALAQQTKDAQTLKLNNCSDPNSEIGKMITAAATGALSKFKAKNLRKPTIADLKTVNDGMAAIQSTCAKILAPGKLVIPGHIDTKSLSSEEIQYKAQQKKLASLSLAPKAKPTPSSSTSKVLQDQFTSEVFPLVVKVFSSPYGRLLSNSTYLQTKLGLNMNADWTKTEFCFGIKKANLSFGDMNTGYFGSPANKILGSRAFVRQNMSELMTTRFPKLKEKFWDHLAEEATLQSTLAQAQQQVAYELLYNSEDNDVKRLIQANPVYAKLACSSMQHESYWEKSSTKSVYQWTKNIVSYGGIGVGFVAGFFSGGSGWALSATIAAGLTSGTVASVTKAKDAIDLKKKDITESILSSGNAVVDQPGVKNTSGSSGVTAEKAMSDYSKQSPEDQKKINEYIAQFESAEATRNLFYGSKISNAKDPNKLKAELLKTARDEKDKAKLEIAYNVVVTGASLGMAKLAPMLSESIARLEAGIVAPSDAIFAVSNCLVIQDCSGVGMVAGIAMKGIHQKFGPVFSSLRKIKGNESKSYEELIDYAAQEISKTTGVPVDKIKAQLRLAMSEKEFKEHLAKQVKPEEAPKTEQKLQVSEVNQDEILKGFDLKAKNLDDFKICNQGKTSNCTLSSTTSFLKLNEYLPAGKEIDPEYMDGLLIWRRASRYLKSMNTGETTAEQLTAGLSKYVINAGSNPGEMMTVLARYQPKLRDVPEVQTLPKMATLKEREKLTEDLAKVFSQAGTKSKELLQAELDALMIKYYGPMQISSKALPIKNGFELKTYSIGFLSESNFPVVKVKTGANEVYETSYKMISPEGVAHTGYTTVEGSITPLSTVTGPRYKQLNLEKYLQNNKLNLNQISAGKYVLVKRADGSYERHLVQSVNEQGVTLRVTGMVNGKYTVTQEVIPSTQPIYKPYTYKTTQPESSLKPNYNKAVTLPDYPNHFIQTDGVRLSGLIKKNLSEGKSMIIALHGDEQTMLSGNTGTFTGLNGNSDLGHAMVIVGVKTNPQNGSIEELLLANSWGAESGIKGFAKVNWNELVQHKMFKVHELTKIQKTVPTMERPKSLEFDPDF